MKRFFLGIMMASMTTVATAQQLPVAGDWKLVFSDEFNGKNADLDAEWISQNGPSSHILCSRWRENATIENGTLRLLNKKEKRGGQEWTSGSIWSKRKFKYGYFEARYKYGAATGLNNSFWIMTTDPKGTEGQFEIDINEGHFPNEVNTNIHRHSGEHLSKSRSFSMGAQPSHSFSLELPIETTKLRLVVRDPGRFSVAEVRVFAPADAYPPAPGTPGGDTVKQTNLAAQATASDTGHFQNFVAANVIDGKLGNESRWVAENVPGPQSLTLEWPQKQRIGCIQLLSGWQDGDKRQSIICDFSLEYWDGAAWTPLTKAGGQSVDFSREFQTYGLLWTEKELVWFFNGKEIRRSANEWCHRAAPVWFSSAIIKWAGEVSDKIDGTSMDIDYVRVYQLNEAPKEAPKSAATAMNFQKAIQPLPPTARFVDADYFIWCGSPIKGDDGKYHLFYSRWLKKYGFNAWVTHSEIARAVSDSPFGPFKHANVVLPPRGAAFWDGLCTHNPTVKKFGGKYYLYYMGNTGDGKNLPTLNWTHRNNQRVGVAVAEQPAGPWTRFDKPLIEPTPNFYDALCLANPSVVARPGGGYLMVYKAVADKKPLPFGGPVLHCVATADSPIGPFKKEANPVFVKEGVHFAAEDPYVWVQDGRYFAIVKDFAGHFTNAGKSLALFESPDGIKWDVSTNALVSRIEVPWQDGRVQKLNLLERPQLLIENGVPVALYCAADEGNGVTTNLQIPLKF